jgi:signal transduction histidine kinase/CheY-like chemotaxis protein
LIHPDDFPLSKDKAIEHLNQLTEDNFEVEYRVRHKEGHYCHLYNRGTVLRTEQGKVHRVIGQTVDITERKLAEEKLRAANERAIVEYEQLLERIALLAQKLGAARELLTIYRALQAFARVSVPCHGLFVSLYDRAKDVRTAAYGWGDGLEIDVSQLPPMPVTKDGPNSRAVRTGNVIITDDYMKATSGHPQVVIGAENGRRPQSSLVVPMSVLGRILGTIEVQSYERLAYKPGHAAAMRMAANLTAVAIENAQLLALESQARAEAEESNRLKDDFLATVSHELRTPLTAILGWARMLDSPLPQPQFMRAIQTIQRNAKAQAELIDDILDVSRIVTGNLYLNLEPTDLTQIVEAAINVVRPTAETKHIQVKTDFADQPTLVSGDAHRLQQVVWNLLSNAVKFTPQGGHVHVSTRHLGAYVHLEIVDNGQGISAEFLPHVFERFRQADSSTTRKHGGLGLGLAIVRHLVEIHGGTVQAESDGEGKGATLKVILPLLADDQSVTTDDDARASSETLKPRPTELQGIHVLLVDDDAGAREVISAALNQHHARVTAVASAREALQVIRRTPPDVLVSDIAMPIEDGYDLIEQVQELEANNGKTIPAVAITAYARVEDRRKALAAGFQSYLAKPIEPADLIEVVARLAR